jgi:hypothetical protein
MWMPTASFRQRLRDLLFLKELKLGPSKFVTKYI